MGQNDGNEKFWVDDPTALISNFQLLPSKDMSLNEKLNTLTRLAIICSVVMYFMEFEYWLIFLITSILIVVSLKYLSVANKKEGFSIPPTYADGSAPMTTVPPLFAEEWQIPPPAYDIYNMSDMENPWTELACESQQCLNQQPYPIYGQYISDTTVLPSQEEEIKNRPLKDAQQYMTDAFTQDQLDYRNSMTRLFVNKINREYRSGCFDQISPYTSW